MWDKLVEKWVHALDSSDPGGSLHLLGRPL